MSETSPEPLDQLATALAAFQADMPIVPKSHTATVRSDKGSYTYTYADLADVSAAAMPLLAKHGLSFVTLPSSGQLTGILLHSSGQTLTASLPVSGGTPQQIGSSLTYMRRYLLGCMTGVVTDDDDDGQTAQGSGKKSPAKRAAPPPPPPQPPPVETGEVMSDKTRARMHALLSEHGIRDRDERLTGIANVIGRPVESSSDLTQAEASKVIKDLEARPPRAPVAPPVAQQARPPRTEPAIDEPPPDLPEADPVDEPAMTEPSAGILIGAGPLASINGGLRAVLTNIPGASATSRDDALNLLAAILTKPVTSTKTLTRQDGMRVLDFLNRVFTGDAFVALDPETRVFETWVGEAKP